MRSRNLGLDPKQALIAAQSCVAIIVGYGLALQFDWKASSVATTVIVLQTAALGSTLNKASMRMVGTLAGAVTGVVLVALFAHDGMLFILSMALLTGVCVWGMQGSKHTYSWMLLLLTSAIVGWPAANNPLTTFQTSIDRVTAVAVGVLLSGIAQSVFWPVTASRQYERSLDDLVNGCHSVLTHVRQGLRQKTIDMAALNALESKLFTLASALDGKLETACADSTRLHNHHSGYRELNDSLFKLFTATTMIGRASAACLQRAAASDLSGLDDAFGSSDRQCVALVQQLSQPRDGTVGPIDVEIDKGRVEETAEAAVRNRHCDFPAQQDLALHSASSLLRRGLEEFATAATRAGRALGTAESLEDPAVVDTAPASPAPKTGTRLRKSALATLQVLLAAYMFLMLNWPLGLQVAMMLVMILAFLNAQLPVALLARTFMKSVLLALPMAAVFHFVVMPQVDSFAELAPWLLILFYPPLYLAACPNPAVSMAANMSILLTNALISISTTPPSYGFASFANTYLGISGGFGVVLFLAYLFETRSPRRGVYQLTTVLLTQMSGWLESLSPTSSEQRDSTTDAPRCQQLVASLGKLKKVAAQVDYGQCPSVSHDSISFVVRSLESLGWHLLWAEQSHSSTQDAAVDQADAFQKTRQWCADSLAATQQSLATAQPVAVLSPNEQTVEAWESPEPDPPRGRASLATASEPLESWAVRAQFYKSLASAIKDCQRQLNRVDWNRWNQNYF